MGLQSSLPLETPPSRPLRLYHVLAHGESTPPEGPAATPPLCLSGLHHEPPGAPAAAAAGTRPPHPRRRPYHGMWVANDPHRRRLQTQMAWFLNDIVAPSPLDFPTDSLPPASRLSLCDQTVVFRHTWLSVQVNMCGGFVRHWSHSPLHSPKLSLPSIVSSSQI